MREVITLLTEIHGNYLLVQSYNSFVTIGIMRHRKKKKYIYNLNKRIEVKLHHLYRQKI